MCLFAFRGRADFVTILLRFDKLEAQDGFAKFGSHPLS